MNAAGRYPIPRQCTIAIRISRNAPLVTLAKGSSSPPTNISSHRPNSVSDASRTTKSTPEMLIPSHIGEILSTIL
jgi:hypothetical protein